MTEAPEGGGRGGPEHSIILHQEMLLSPPSLRMQTQRSGELGGSLKAPLLK